MFVARGQTDTDEGVAFLPSSWELEVQGRAFIKDSHRAAGDCHDAVTVSG